MSGALSVTRAQVLAYRVAAQGLHRGSSGVGELAVLDIGVQEAMGQPAALAFAARLPDSVSLGSGDVAIGPGHRLALAWSLRGAPHVHRRRDLDKLAAALWPMSEQDATARLGESAPNVRKKGIAALDQFALAVEALRDVVREPTPKGEASTAVTKRVPAAMRKDCRSCKTAHISDPAMRVAALAAGLELDGSSSPPLLAPRPKSATPSKTDTAALRRLALGYLTLLGPATAGDFAGYVEARRADVETVWPDASDTVAQVTVDGREAWLPAGQVDALQKAPTPNLVRLLGPFDPYLQARDRDLIVPGKGVQKALWPVLGRPGAVLSGGEVAAGWRTKTSGTKLTITVTEFTRLPKSAWQQVEAEAQRIAAVRGASDVAVVRPD